MMFGLSRSILLALSGWNGRRQPCPIDYSNIRDESFSAVTPAEVMAIADRKILLMISQKGMI